MAAPLSGPKRMPYFPKADAPILLSKHVSMPLRPNINKRLATGRTIQLPSRDLEMYIGSYFNAVGNLTIQMKYIKDETNRRVAYMGRGADTFGLVPYQDDRFYWSSTFDESVRLGQEALFPVEYHILSLDLE
jgi:hypothetical protein